MCDTPSSSSSSEIHIRDRVCRLCLAENPKLVRLENLYFDDIYFLDIIRDSFSVEINLEQDHLPLLICRKCIQSTMNFQTFKNSIIENEVFLQSVNLDEVQLKLKRNSTESEAESEALSEERTPQEENNAVHNAKKFWKTLEQGEHQKYAKKPIKPTEKQTDNLSNVESGYACSICSSHDRKPIKKIHREKGYVCTTCNASFPTPSDWKKHMISHYASQKYHCLQCTESFDSKHEFLVHTYVHLYKNSEEKKCKLAKRIINKN